MALDGAAAFFVQVQERDLFFAGPVQDLVAQRLGQLLEGRLDVEFVMGGQAGQQRVRERIAAVPAADRAGGQAQFRKGDDPLRIEEAHLADAVAAGAGAHRIVEAEQAWLQLRQAVAAHRAGVAAGEDLLALVVHVQRQGAAFGKLQGGFEALGQALLALGPDAQAVDDDVDVVLLSLFQRRHAVDFQHLAVDAQAHIALRLQAGAFVLEAALLAARDGGQHGQPRLGRPAQHRVDHLADALGLQRQAVIGAVGRAHPRVEQAQVVVDLGDGADRGAGIVSRGLLLDRDGRRQPLDEIHVRLVHQLQELAGVGGKTFHVAPLALRVQRVERQRGFAGPGQTCDHHQLVARQVQRDVLEIVGAGTPDAYAHVCMGNVQLRRRRL